MCPSHGRLARWLLLACERTRQIRCIPERGRSQPPPCCECDVRGAYGGAAIFGRGYKSASDTAAPGLLSDHDLLYPRHRTVCKKCGVAKGQKIPDNLRRRWVRDDQQRVWFSHPSFERRVVAIVVEVERGGEVASKRPDRIAIGKLGVAHLTSSDMELSLSCSQCTTLRLAPVGKAIPRAAR